MATNDHPSTAAASSTSSGRVGSSTVGIGLATAFFLVGAVNFYLIPTTGGLTSSYWHPVLYDIVLSRPVLVLIYIPLVQLPLATVYLLRSRELPERRLGPRFVFGLFGLIAILRVAILAAEVAYPLDAGSLQPVVDTILFGEFVGRVGIPEFVTTVYLWYFAGAVYAGLLVDRLGRRGRPDADLASTPPSQTGDRLDDDQVGSSQGTVAAAEGHRRGVRAQWSVPGVSAELRIPFWAVAGGVAVLLIGGAVTGGLESAIGVAGILLSLYELQPTGDT